MDLQIMDAGGHGCVVKEVAEATRKYKRLVFLNDSYDGANLAATCTSVVGKLSDYEKYITSFSHTFVTIGNPNSRNQWQVRLATVGCQMPIPIHPDA